MYKQILYPKKGAADRGLGDMRFPQRGAYRFLMLINNSPVRSGKRRVIHNQVVGIVIYRSGDRICGCI